MRRFRTILALGIPALAAALWTFTLLSPARAMAQEGVSLLQTLDSWKYPESKLADGAEMSDGGILGLSSIKCRAVLSTGDPIDKVIAFYAAKFVKDAGEAVKDADARSISTQDDSKGRPVTIRVIVVNKANSSTTLVISRANGEKETHIAWSHFLRLGNKL